MTELDQFLAKILRDFKGEEVSKLDERFDKFWGSLKEEQREEYLEILRTRSEMILPDREHSGAKELLPWKLYPNSDELASLLDTWFPRNMSKTIFVRECIRWKVSTSQTIIENQIILGARRTQIHRFANMMLERHSNIGDGESPVNPEDILTNMINEGHFSQFEYGLILPNLYNVKVSENQRVLISGWPYKMLARDERIQGLEIKGNGLYLSQKHDDIPEITLAEYSRSLDPIKSLATSAENYIDILIEMLETNAYSSGTPAFNDLIPIPGKQKHAEGSMSFAHHEKNIMWDTGKHQFYITSGGYSPEGYVPPRIWKSSQQSISRLNECSWKSIPLRMGALKQLKLAYVSVIGKPEKLSKCKLKTAEIVRFSIIMKDVEIDEKIIRDFCEKNWLVE